MLVYLALISTTNYVTNVGVHPPMVQVLPRAPCPASAPHISPASRRRPALLPSSALIPPPASLPSSLALYQSTPVFPGRDPRLQSMSAPVVTPTRCPPRTSPVMPMDERREMDSATDAHRVAWLQHGLLGLLVLRQLHPIRPSICLHLHEDATVRHPIMGGARGHGGQLLLPEAAPARRFFAGARDRRLFFYDHAMGEGRGPTLPSAAAWPFYGGGPPAASCEQPREKR